jgi:uncharacterized delta-60 repeat protein
VTEEWVERFNGPDNLTDVATDIGVDADGNVVITGHSYGSTTNYDLKTIKYNGLTGAVMWSASYNAPPGNLSDFARALDLDAAGNVFVTGSSENASGFPDYTTIKYDAATGARLWVAQYNGPDNRADMATDIEIDAAGNAVVTGSSYGLDTNYDYLTVKYNGATGAQVWTARYNAPPGFYTDSARALDLDSAGDIVVTGSSENADSVTNYATVKYSGGTGAQLWVTQFNGPDNKNDSAADVKFDSSGNVVVTGASYGIDTNYDYQTLKYNGATGAQMWSARYNAPPGFYSDFARALALDASGNVVVTGSSEGVATDPDYATVKYSGDTGAQVWVSRYDGPVDGSDGATAVAVDTDGNTYVTGGASVSVGVQDYATVKYAANGAEEWVMRYNGPANADDLATALALDGSGNVYVTGYSQSTVADFATVKYSQAQPDTTAPACAVGAVVVASPSRVYVPVTLTDAGSGVAQVKLTTNSSNCVLEWDGPGGLVTAPINTVLHINPPSAGTVVRAVKVNSAQRARVELRVADAAGNFVVCDPVIANLEVKNGRAPLIRTFTGIPHAERYVTLQNGAPGLTQATLSVNGRVVSQGRLTDGQTVSLDIAQWLRPGDRNVVRISARGPRGATAVLTIGDVQPGSSHGHAPTVVNREFSR